ncbi:DNA polymerase III subunit beta [Blattabacterium cuenoti]|uniref:DNA polymerase III subunit beta n=1 Tax=Blattabacterium cuenoti TaxID=1653831 RepID=UPI00163C38F2|nr:DNA polymerase III subunit beta [Blattabacterium cuenoti]
MKFYICSSSLLNKLYFLYKISNCKKNLYFVVLASNNKELIIYISNTNSVFITKIQTCIEQTSKEQISISITLMINFLQTFINDTVLLVEKRKNILVILYKQDSYYLPIYRNNDTKHLIYPIISDYQNKPIIKIVFSYSILLKILNYTLFFYEKQYLKHLKYIINGVVFQLTPDVYNFISTDTYRLIQYTITHNNFTNNLPIELIIHFSSLRKLHNILKQKLHIKQIIMVIEKYNQENIVQFQIENNIFFCKSFNNPSITFNSIFPTRTDISFIINKNLFLNSIKRIYILSNNNPCIIRFSFKNKVKNTLKIYEEASINNNYSIIKCKFKLLDNNHNIIIMRFNTKFLIEILSSIDEYLINFEFSCDKNIGLLKPIVNRNNKELIKILIMSII